MGLDRHNRILADTEVSMRCPGVSQVHELLSKIHLEISHGDTSSDGMTNETRDNPERQEWDPSSQMGQAAASRSGIPETEDDHHRGTDPREFGLGEANHSSNGCVRICDCRHPQRLQYCRGSQAGRFPLPEVLVSLSELRRLWSGAISHCGNTKTVAALPRGHQLQGHHLVGLQQSRIHPDIQSALQVTSQVVRNSFGLRLCHWAPRGQQQACRWPVQMAWLRDRLWKAFGTTIGDCLSGAIRQSHATNHRGPGFRPFGCWCLGRASWRANCGSHKFQGRGEWMESRHGGSYQSRENIHSCGWPPTWKSHKSLSWQTRVRSFWSSPDYRAGILGFLLASNGLACT